MTDCFLNLYMQNLNMSYNVAIIERLQLILQYSGLEIPGFSEFTGISESHLYALLNGTKKLTGKIADKIGDKIGISGWKILQLDYEISPAIRKNNELIKFYKSFKEVNDYFIDTQDKRKQSYYIEHVLLKTNFFDDKKYVWQVLEKCVEANRQYSSKDLSQILNHLVKKEILNKEKRQYKSKDDVFSLKNRMVYVFYK